MEYSRNLAGTSRKSGILQPGHTHTHTSHPSNTHFSAFSLCIVYSRSLARLITNQPVVANTCIINRLALVFAIMELLHSVGSLELLCFYLVLYYCLRILISVESNTLKALIVSHSGKDGLDFEEESNERKDSRGR